MYDYEIAPTLKEILIKLSKKDRNLWEQTMDKIEEIINSSDAEHYKNLRYSMKNYKRVHIGHFVLIFEFDKTNNKLIFANLEHHDDVYK